MGQKRSSPLQAALQSYLQKWYPETIEQEQEVLNDKKDDTVTEISTISTDAMEIDVEKFFKFAAAKELRDSVEGLRKDYGVYSGSSRGEGNDTAEDGE